MQSVELVRAEPGAQKVSCTTTLQEHCGLGLSDAKHVTDAMLEHRRPRVTVPSEAAANTLVSALAALGVTAQLVDEVASTAESASPPAAKVLFRVPEEDGSANVETLWAFSLGGDEYQLDNLPFYAYAVSAGDVVHAPFDEAEGFPTLVRVVRKSGNRTVRVIFDERPAPGNQTERVLNELVAVGCSYEGASGTYLAVNIPATVKLESVRAYLVEQCVQWEHADPTYDELHPNSQ